jgi:hypothetical protein
MARRQDDHRDDVRHASSPPFDRELDWFDRIFEHLVDARSRMPSGWLGHRRAEARVVALAPGRGRRGYRVAVTDTAKLSEDAADRTAIQAVVDAFFGAFVSGAGCAERMDRLRRLFVPGAVVVRTCGPEPLVMGVEEFKTPREAQLTGGSLVDFREWPVSGRVEVFGDVAHWFGSYAKSGVLDGEAFTGAGMKSIQLVRTADGWRVSAAAWDDERDSVTLPGQVSKPGTDPAVAGPR